MCTALPTSFIVGGDHGTLASLSSYPYLCQAELYVRHRLVMPLRMGRTLRSFPLVVSRQACPLRLGGALTLGAEHPCHERQQRLQRLKVGGLSRDYVFHPPGQGSLLNRRIRPQLDDKGAGDRQGGRIVC